MSEWISVSERKPLDGLKVLVLKRHHAPTVQSALFWGNRFIFAGETLIDVTHWMPLPDPPDPQP
jgi:hypothetical protein